MPQFARRFVLTLTICLFALKGWAAERPNILFILTDDQAPWALGLSGHPHAKTPHLDELFKSGAYLTNCFTVTPVCSPSRASLMTSRYGSELGITDWIKPQNEEQLGLDPTLPTWPKLLHDAGYQTALIGKWHLGTPDRYHPTVFGFDYFMGFRAGGTTPNNPLLEVNGQEQQVRGLTTDIFGDEAIRWLRLHNPKKGPFAMALHFRAPHARWLPVRDEDWAPFDGLDPTIPNPDYPDLDVDRVKTMTREYLASVAGVDRNVGRLMAELKLLGLEKNTVVIYSSDHGYNMGHNGIWHKGNGHWVLKTPPPATENIPKGQRPNMYDNSIRVPTCVRWPGVVEPGREITETVSNLDWFPTLMDITDTKFEGDVLIHGRSIITLLRDTPKASRWDNGFYAEYSTHHQAMTHMRMYRLPEAKLIRDYKNPERDEYFDLVNDPAETTNLIGSDDPAVQRMVKLLDGMIREKMQENGDAVLELATQK
ncbi:MAG: sulfatase-like hydrolase/transferase [Planctomycetaceae bacterium]|nr:sulfatase-like hydrolase/transferase [Planctomycetaceae bacterium]MCB9953000.1 sulfatase-like hydrolase/transferase [Planctomycetaceae bacterium]